ncbi:MAG: hypothetical protein Q8Q04_01005 [archaeon]|nr:hypothetical protein [archaeon]
MMFQGPSIPIAIFTSSLSLIVYLCSTLAFSLFYEGTSDIPRIITAISIVPSFYFSIKIVEKLQKIN